MINSTSVMILTCYLLLSCNQTGKYYPPDRKDSAEAAIQTVETSLPENDLQLFCNNEITPYCVLLPLHEFKEDYNDSLVVKAQHKFLLIQDSTSFTSIEVQAYTIDKKNNFNTAIFYKRDKKDVAEGGLGIDTAYMDEANHLYLIKGYLPNYMNMKFIQLNWILEDRISLYINYDEKDEGIWKLRLAAIINRGVAFSDK